MNTPAAADVSIVYPIVYLDGHRFGSVETVDLELVALNTWYKMT